jgi:UPF0716 protein FxsA
LVFIVVPVLELALLIKTGQVIGVWATVALVLTTALSGAFIISRQSLSVLRRSLEALSEGRTPVAPVVDGLFLLVAGALLLTPGLLTDIVALALLVPPLRRAVARAAMAWMLHRAQVSITVDDEPWGPDGRRRPSGNAHGPVIDGEFERLDERPREPRQGGRRPPPR